MKNMASDIAVFIKQYSSTKIKLIVSLWPRNVTELINLVKICAFFELLNNVVINKKHKWLK